GLQELLQLEEDGVFARSKHIGQHLPGVVINGVPEPSRMRFRLHKTPHFVELRAEPTMHLQLICAPDFHFDLRGMQGRQHAMIHRLQLWLFFCSSFEFITVYGLWYAMPPPKGGTTYGECTMHRCAGPSRRVPGFDQLDAR